MRLCKSCRYWQQSEKSGFGDCRVHAPSLGSEDSAAWWPITRAIDWCGDHDAPLGESKDGLRKLHAVPEETS